MTRAKIDLTMFDVVEYPSEFPYPGVLKSRSAADVAAILDDARTFFTAPGSMPEGVAGFGWWPVVDETDFLGPMETYGDPVLTVDQFGRRVSLVRPIIAPSVGDLAAYYDRLESELHQQIDTDAEARRLDFITAGAGQSQTYALKLAEAEAINNGAVPTAAAHPFIWKEAQALGKSAAVRAVEIVATRNAWVAVGSDIEAARQSAQAAVTAAKGDELQMKVAAAVDWAAIGGA